MQAAEANLRIAQNQLGYTQLLAPNDGVVTATGADPGQVVEAGQMVVEISRDAEREAVFAVAGADVDGVTPGMQGKVWLQAQPEVAVTGSVREISPVADSATGHLRGAGLPALGAAGDAPRRHRRRPRRSRGRRK